MLCADRQTDGRTDGQMDVRYQVHYLPRFTVDKDAEAFKKPPLHIRELPNNTISEAIGSLSPRHNS